MLLEMVFKAFPISKLTVAMVTKTSDGHQKLSSRGSLTCMKFLWQVVFKLLHWVWKRLLIPGPDEPRYALPLQAV